MDISLIMGPMFSGKSTELIRRCSNASSVGLKVCIINHTYDNRCKDDTVQTHYGVVAKALKVQNLLEVDIHDYDVIGIDEAQFFDDLLDFVKSHEHNNKVLIVAGLDGDYQRQPFGNILNIIPFCQNVTKLNAMCIVCKNGITNAAFTYRNSTCTNTICVGGKDIYQALCRKHYMKVFTPST